MYLVTSILQNTVLPYFFGTKGEALTFYDAQRDSGYIYTQLFEMLDDGLCNPLDPEAVRHNLKTSGIWL
jgi:hypothetical protein